MKQTDVLKPGLEYSFSARNVSSLSPGFRICESFNCLMKQS